VTQMTAQEALLWCKEYGVTARRVDGAVTLSAPPQGVKVPSGLIDALKKYDGDLEAITTGDAAQIVREPQGMSLKELMQCEFTPRREFVPGIIVQGVTLLASKAKIGKTWLTLNTGLALATGGRAFGKIEVEKVGVLILSLEDGPQRLQDRFALLLEETKPPDGLYISTEWPRLGAGGEEKLDNYLRDHPDVKVIFIDTLAKIRPARRKGGDLYQEDYHIGEVLKAISEKHGVAIVVIYHTRKASADDPLDEIRDTMGLTGGVDNCLVLRRARGQADAELFVSGRDIAEEKGYALTWDKITTQWIIAGDASEYAVSTARKQVLDALVDAPNGLTPTQVARKLNKPLSAVNKLMWTMSKDGTLMVTDRRYKKRGKDGKEVRMSQGTLAEQGKPDTNILTSSLPDLKPGKDESKKVEGQKGSDSKENDHNSYFLTDLTDDGDDGVRWDAPADDTNTPEDPSDQPIGEAEHSYFDTPEAAE